MLDSGSSPLARGTPRGAHPQSRSGRFIPARAGNTTPPRRRSRCLSVHPRSRGEHHAMRDVGTYLDGSSPLARGTLRECGAHGQGQRFIPARAGNTGEAGAAPTPPSVHPRSRGEHSCSTLRPIRSTGSSPLARGTPEGCREQVPDGRFIPARAGNTRPGPARWTCSPVHPRSRGEHTYKPPSMRSPFGSSPLARGTPALRGHHHDGRRFIPARAGNTSGSSSWESSRAVHPRSRGEHRVCRTSATRLYGSSPLARGTQRSSLPLPAAYRFIPARAGNTRSPSGAGCRPTVHPRSRGEHEGTEDCYEALYGSSPLARGTRARGQRPPGEQRFIPARAGNTCTGSRAAKTRPVHPRSRGEHARVEGQHFIGRRFIPARAGNTARRPSTPTA